MAATPRPALLPPKNKPPASFRSGVAVATVATIAGCMVGSFALLYATFLSLVGPAHGRGLMAVPIFLVPTVLFLGIGTALRAIHRQLNGDYFKGAAVASAGTFLVMAFVLANLIST